MILAAGLTPTWQRVQRFDDFIPGEVNRATETHACASGKVLNVAVAAHLLSTPVKALAPVGRDVTGTAIRGDLESGGVIARWIESSAPARTCTTLLTPEGVTELVENSGPVTDAERETFLATFHEEASTARLIVLSGSLPPGTPATFHGDCIKATRIPVILDARGEELLAALPEKPFLVKPNRRELGATLNRDLAGDADLHEAMKELRRRGAKWVVVTDGPKPVHALGDGEIMRIPPAKVTVVNPIGCGDAFAAGLATSLMMEPDMADMEKAIGRALSAAAASAAHILPGRLEPPITP